MFCTELLEHVADWKAAWGNLTKLVAQGGELFITSPFVFPRHEEPHDYFRGTPAAFGHFAAAHGFEIVFQKPAGDFNEVLGTVAGYALKCFDYEPASSGLVARLRQRIQRWGLMVIAKLCRAGGFRPALGHTRAFYLSNILLLRKV